MRAALLIPFAMLLPAVLAQNLVVRGKTVYTMAGQPIADGMVVVRDGKIAAVGAASSLAAPAGLPVYEAAVVAPGLVDARSTVGMTGFLNQDQDQEQVETSSAIQPELRAIDAYNGRDPLVRWALEHGVTTVHTGHGPAALLSGQTMIIKTNATRVDEGALVPQAMLAVSLGDSARGANGKSPGTQAKMLAMLRGELIKARGYAEKVAEAEEGKEPPRDLGNEMLAKALAGEIPVLISANREREILNALRLAEEFGFRLVLADAAEAYLLLDRIKAAEVPVILHPTMKRSFGERENLSMETAAKLREAGILFALQSGFEAYVPKTRVVLFEAAVAAAHGLGLEGALASVTIDAARILGVDDRVGSLEVGKDGDLALFDGDPFEYTSHVTHVIIDGALVSDRLR